MRRSLPLTPIHYPRYVQIPAQVVLAAYVTDADCFGTPAVGFSLLTFLPIPQLHSANSKFARACRYLGIAPPVLCPK